MTNIPEHLFKAAHSAEATAEAAIAAVLAALRPEDAHLVPAWQRERGDWICGEERLAGERDEARAEVERLKACNCDPLDDAYRLLHHPTCPKAQR